MGPAYKTKREADVNLDVAYSDTVVEMPWGAQDRPMMP